MGTLSRLFGGDGFFCGGAWWIIVLFFLFLAFQECWADICITDWIPFLILLLIVCSCGLDGGCGDNFECGC
ncbi:hypothetical protein QJR30_02445 [Paraclostridium sordellii]|uniref:hypothetical protein n=1 Tax=Paraclostridium sordellii TaxID=1505 RepID=UPI0005DF84CD|nr:hypothetical protein [Paeniclostridium sordellii]CEP79345.1 Uncharacterised protein [[Clostridium] sordellii] [Paeniclostridium sordellii]